MKLKKCTNTVTGKHIWGLYSWLELGKSETVNGRICKLCNLVDDRQEVKQ